MKLMNKFASDLQRTLFSVHVGLAIFPLLQGVKSAWTKYDWKEHRVVEAKYKEKLREEFCSRKRRLISDQVTCFEPEHTYRGRWVMRVLEIDMTTLAGVARQPATTVRHMLYIHSIM